jgi:cytochrome c biogenesis protein CcdA/thiol-disulfide isomerase/thioredoxin
VSTLLLVGFVGGLITGVSPCVLPVLPAVFMAGGTQAARESQFAGPGPAATVGTLPRSDVATARRPYLVIAGLVLSFSVFTLLGTLVLGALHLPQDVVRWAGLVVLVLLGIGMIVPRFESLLERPFARIPALRLGSADRPGAGDRSGFVLGLALGAVYVPCAGPVLAAITVAGATGHIGGGTIALTLAFAVGTAIPLLFFALAGRRVAERVAVFRRHQRGIRIGAGVVVIALAVALTFNVTDFLQRAIPDYTNGLNTALDKAGATEVPKALGAPAGDEQLAICGQDLRPTLQNCGPAPEIAGISQWLNTPGGDPITIASLRGKVVLVDFWAYSCINCQRAIPHVNAWYSAYARDGLEVIGVHTPEYAFEHVAANVVSGAARLKIGYPIALDNAYTTWNNFSNQSWPAEYLIDPTGEVRHVSIGEGSYPAMENMIRQLLTAAKPAVALPKATAVDDTTPAVDDLTPETYLGGKLEQTFAGPSPLVAGRKTYHYPAAVPDNEYALSGEWSASDESITAAQKATIKLNYFASDVYLDVGGTGSMTATVGGRTTKYSVSGAPNIYQLVTGNKTQRGSLNVSLSPGLTAYSFTFG